MKNNKSLWNIFDVLQNFFGEMSQIWVKRIFFVILEKIEQKFWPKRKTSQPIFWTFLNNFLSQNLVLTCNISHLWRKRTFFRWIFKKFYDQEKRKNLVAMFYVLVRTFASFFVGWWKKSVLPIVETFLQKSFREDQKFFRGTCCF